MKYTFLTLNLLALSLHMHAAQIANTQTQIDTLFNIVQYKNEGMVYETLRNFFQQHPDLADHALQNEQGKSFIHVVSERFKNNHELRLNIIKLLLHANDDDAKQAHQQNLQEEPKAFSFVGDTWQQVSGPAIPSADDLNAVSEEEAQRFKKIDENCRTQ